MLLQNVGRYLAADMHIISQDQFKWHNIPHACSDNLKKSTVELGYNVTKGTEYFVSLQMSVVTTQQCTVTVNSDELTGTTEYLTQ
jgi:hypothetical protein